MLLTTTSIRKGERRVQQETLALLHLDHSSILDGAQLRVAVKRDVPQPEREACAVAGDLMLHQHLVQLSHQHLSRNLIIQSRGHLHHCAYAPVSSCHTSQPEAQSVPLREAGS